MKKENKQESEGKRSVGHAVKSCNENAHIIPYLYLVFKISEKSVFFC